MLKKFLLILLIFLVGCSNDSLTDESASRPELLFYVGITMVKPVSELAREFEHANNCRIKIIQGGSQDLYDSLKTSGLGDLYLPGSLSYRSRNFADGLLLDTRFVGYNQASIMVAKGNPQGFPSDLSLFSNPV
ncbi:MAG: molybdenum ABC transporter substrate-binding protein, partial [Desulfuromonas sp.]